MSAVRIAVCHYIPSRPTNESAAIVSLRYPSHRIESYLRKRYSSEPNLISGPEIVIVVVDPDPVGDVLALLLDHVEQAHGLVVEA